MRGVLHIGFAAGAALGRRHEEVSSLHTRDRDANRERRGVSARARRLLFLGASVGETRVAGRRCGDPHARGMGRVGHHGVARGRAHRLRRRQRFFGDACARLQLLDTGGNDFWRRGRKFYPRTADACDLVSASRRAGEGPRGTAPARRRRAPPTSRAKSRERRRCASGPGREEQVHADDAKPNPPQLTRRGHRGRSATTDQLARNWRGADSLRPGGFVRGTPDCH